MIRRGLDLSKEGPLVYVGQRVAELLTGKLESLKKKNSANRPGSKLMKKIEIITCLITLGVVGHMTNCNKDKHKMSNRNS